MKLVLIVCVIGVVFALNPLDEAGVNKIMKSSGCGNKDLTQPDEIVKNYTTSDKWNKPNNHITYSLENKPKKLTRKDLLKEIKRAFGIYAKYTRLNFSETHETDEVDIDIGFYRGEHGDSNPFGLDPELDPAHAYGPGVSSNIKGDIHFNMDIIWSIDFPGEKFFNHLMHQIGHALGLRDSSAEGSVMNPIYLDKLKNKQETIIALGLDDIRGLESLYGCS